MLHKHTPPAHRCAGVSKIAAYWTFMGVGNGVGYCVGNGVGIAMHSVAPVTVSPPPLAERAAAAHGVVITVLVLAGREVVATCQRRALGEGSIFAGLASLAGGLVKLAHLTLGA
jgi:hypothetical protein